MLATRRQHGHETTQKPSGRILALRLIVFVAEPGLGSLYFTASMTIVHAHTCMQKKKKAFLKELQFLYLKGCLPVMLLL